MKLENIGENCISVISEYLTDYISFALVSRQFRDSWVGEKESSKKLLQGSVENGNLEMVKYYIKNGCPWDEDVCSNAALCGHLEILKWARSETWDEWIYMYADMEMLKWERSEGCPWDEKVCINAAFGGHLEILKWARSEGCPWDEEVCTYAARNGHLEVIKWAKSEGCPWNGDVCKNAAGNGHLDVLQWVREWM